MALIEFQEQNISFKEYKKKFRLLVKNLDNNKNYILYLIFVIYFIYQCLSIFKLYLFYCIKKKNIII